MKKSIMKYLISLISFLLFMSCHKEKDFIGKWQIVDVQLEKVDSMGLAGFIFTTFSDEFPKPTTLIVDSDSIYMFSDNQKLVSQVFVLLYEQKSTYFLSVAENAAQFEAHDNGRGLFTIDGMTYVLKR